VKDPCYAVILAGGKGERFWPMSTARRPKQLLNLMGERSFLALAVERVRDIIPPERVLVITNAELVEASRAAAPELPPENIVGEPVGRDTAAAVALAAVLVEARDPKGVFCTLTADHVIGDLDVFRHTLQASADLAAREEVIVTIGIKPTEPSTSYGYIEAGDQREGPEGVAFFRARRFVEKPDEDTAQRYLDTGRYYWNSGMFVWSPSTLRAGFKRHAPHLRHLMDDLRPFVGAADFTDRVSAVYAALERISIDYALLEKSDNIVMAKGVFAWDDLGSWPALERHFAKDEDANVRVGDVQVLDAQRNIVFSEGRLTALIGVEDLVVVQTDRVTLVCPKGRAQEIKAMVRQLTDAGSYGEVL